MDKSFLHIFQHIPLLSCDIGQYEGESKHGVAQGQGTLFSSSPSEFIYVGQFKDNLAHGIGNFIDTKENFTVFGEFEGGALHGIVCLKTNDNRFIGTVKKTKCQDFGELTLASKSYSGYYKNGDRSGFGILVNNKKGKIFKGHFLKDKIHGLGIEFIEEDEIEVFQNGGIYYEGEIAAILENDEEKEHAMRKIFEIEQVLYTKSVSLKNQISEIQKTVEGFQQSSSHRRHRHHHHRKKSKENLNDHPKKRHSDESPRLSPHNSPGRKRSSSPMISPKRKTSNESVHLHRNHSAEVETVLTNTFESNSPETAHEKSKKSKSEADLKKSPKPKSIFPFSHNTSSPRTRARKALQKSNERIQSFPERFPSLRTPNLPPTLTAKQLEKALKNETEEAADEETVDSATESNSFNSVSSNQTSSFSSQTNSTDSGRGIVTLLEKLRNSNRRATTLRGVKKPTLSVVLAQESFQPGETVSGFLSLELPKNHMVKACYASFVTRAVSNAKVQSSFHRKVKRLLRTKKQLSQGTLRSGHHELHFSFSTRLDALATGEKATDRLRSRTLTAKELHESVQKFRSTSLDSVLIQDESDDFVMSYCLEVSIRFQRQSPLFVRFPVLIEQRDQDNKRAFLTRTVSTPVSGAKAVNSVPFRPRQRSMPNPDVSLDVLSQLEVEINQVVEKYDKEQQLALLWLMFREMEACEKWFNIHLEMAQQELDRRLKLEETMPEDIGTTVIK